MHKPFPSHLDSMLKPSRIHSALYNPKKTFVLWAQVLNNDAAAEEVAAQQFLLHKHLSLSDFYWSLNARTARERERGRLGEHRLVKWPQQAKHKIDKQIAKLAHLPPRKQIKQ